MNNLDCSALMQQRIRHIMLVCSVYDQFILEQDGRIEAQIMAEYSELSLTGPPRFTRVNSAQTAIEMLESEQYDLIITMFNIGEWSPFEFCKMVKNNSPCIPIVLLTSFSHEISRRLDNEDTASIDYVFGWQGNADVLLAIIKMVEDNMNAEQDMLHSGVQGVLLIEDSIRFYSAYLPDLYGIMIRQTNSFVTEALSQEQRTLRKRARPKILFARTYNQALELYNKYKKNLLGVISDVSFKIDRADAEQDNIAGIKFCTMVRSDNHMLPLLIQSSNTDIRPLADELCADFIDKNSKTLLLELQDFISRRMAFGDFRFIDPKTGKSVARAGDLGQLQTAIESLPMEVLLHYSAQNMFSKWLYARGLFSLASMMQHLTNSSFESGDALRAYLLGAVKDYRRQMGQGVIVEFDGDTYNKYIPFVRSGNGSLGGKARSLAFVNGLIQQYGLYQHWQGVRVTIPRTFVVTTSHFDQFMEQNGLEYIVTEIMDDQQILSEFLGARLDEQLMSNLKIFLSTIERPLAIRSSSKLEDSHYQPFAGIYSTYMVPRVENDDRQLRLVTKAIKAVYASVFFRASRSYIEATGNLLSQESMAVVVQEVCGSEQDGCYFPTISGVARSLNFYPLGDEKPEEGICNIAFGLGKMVVEGGKTLRFSPAHPKHTLQLSTPEITLRDTQRTIYALDLNPLALKNSTNDGVNIVSLDIQKISHFRNMAHVASTWDMQNDRISDSPLDKGRKIITFASVLKYDSFPLAQIVSRLLELGSQAMLSPVEIEFAVNMDVPQGQSAVFNFLQIRPIAESGRSQTMDWTDVDTSHALIYAQKALGLGKIEGIHHIMYVRPQNFDPSQSQAIAQEIAMLNAQMKQRGEHYILVGPGRWGSSDPWLGIPVRWDDISQSKVIAECGLEKFRVDPSQGTHFFQNITSFGVGYITMNPFLDDGIFDVQALEKMTAQYQTDNIKVVAFDHELFVFIDGNKGRAIVSDRPI